MSTLYGLIGYPVKHSLSARMHNAAFRHLSIDAEYKLFEVKPDELKRFFDTFRTKGMRGINITIPYKTKAMHLMDDLGDEARMIEAINTVALKSKRLIGYNTDGIGFIKSLKEDLHFEPKGKTAFILGAGGAARAVSFSLAKEALQRIVLVDIDPQKAASLAGDVEKKTDTESIAIESGRETIKELLLNSDLLVNATPCGMRKTDPEILPAEALCKGLVIFDLVYNPKETPLIKSARKRNLACVNGLGMLVYQGAASFKLWTGRAAPLGVMKKAVGCLV